MAFDPTGDVVLMHSHPPRKSKSLGIPQAPLQDTRSFALASVVVPLLDWYRRHARVLPWRENTDPYRVWISEIMLQQTRVEAVIPYYERFLMALANVRALAEADPELLLKLWEGLGYYNRVRNLQKAAQKIVTEFGGDFPRDRLTLLSLPGIGDYTAGAIASICFGLPEPAVDGNVLRVIARVTGDRTDIGSPWLKKEVAAALRLVYPEGRCGDFTQALMELGALVCVPNGSPRCTACPLSDLCCASINGLTAEIPVKATAKSRKVEERTVWLLIHDGKVGLRKRPATGLLAGLWEFPSEEGRLTPAQLQKKLKKQGVTARSIQELGIVKHIFSHIEWHMTGYLVACSAACGDLTWADAEALQTTYSLPSAFRDFMRKVLPILDETRLRR